MLRRTLLAAMVGTLALTAPGCFFDPDIELVVGAIEAELEPAELEPQTEIRIGRGLMTLAKGIIGLVPDSEVAEARAYFKGVNEIHVGVYDVYGLDRRRRGIEMPPAMRDRLEKEGWQTIVQAVERDASIWVMANAGRSRLGGLYVVVLEDDELVVVKLKGNLSRTIEAAVRHAMRHDSHGFSRSIREAAGA